MQRRFYLCDDGASDYIWAWISAECGEEEPEPPCSGDGHDWVASVDIEGGLKENPGVWSIGGTRLVIRDHCRHCSLRRERLLAGAQRDHGERDSVTYSQVGEIW